jgi:hypothetical protein
MKKIALIILIFIICSFPFNAQQWNWTIISINIHYQQTYSFGSGGISLVTDDSGNVFMGGCLSDTVTLCDTTISSNSSQTELLVVKFSASGKPRWIKHTGGVNNSSRVAGIKLDKLGNCYITGGTNAICYFDTIMTNSNGGNSSFYIAKINPSGAFVWARVAGRTLPWEESYGTDIAISRQNEIYVVGCFSDNVFLQGTQLFSNGGRDIFIAKYDQNGYLKWAKQAGSIYNDNPSSVAVDTNGNCYVTGQVNNSAVFDQFLVQTNGGSRDGFIAKLDSAGNYLWVKNFGSNQTDIGNSIAYSPLGYLFFTGQINGDALFDSITVQNHGGSDIFIAKYDLSGNILFAKGFGGINNENGRNIFVNHLGNILVTGEFDGTAVFDTTQLPSQGQTDLFAAEFNYDGNLDWIIKYGTSLIDYGNAITADRFDNVFVSGMTSGYEGSISRYDFSVFLGKIKNPVTPVELNSFSSIYAKPNVLLTWETATELNNRIFEIERSTDKTDWLTIGFKEGKGTTLEPHQYSYSDNISGISSQKFYYRLKQIDFNGTYKYSDVVEIEITPAKFSLSQNYPNPFNPGTVISYSLPKDSNIKLTIYNSLGQSIKELENGFKNAGNYSINFYVSDLPSGIYFYRLEAGQLSQVKKMILIK